MTSSDPSRLLPSPSVRNLTTNDATARARSRRRPRWRGMAIVVGLAGLLGALALVPTPTASSQAADGAPEVEREMVVESTTPPEVEVVPVAEAPIGAMSGSELYEIGAHAAHDPERQLVRSVDEAPFSMVGVGFQGGVGESTLLRVLQPDDTWSEWVALEVGGHGGDEGTEEAVDGQDRAPTSEPVWVDEAVGYEIDLPPDATDVQVHLVREGEQEVVLDQDDAGVAAIGPPAGQPPIATRGQWGAAPFRGTPAYASRIVRAVIHHTVNGNGYSQGQVPGMIRGIQSYHQNANGWSDIGYNFVVDRFGTIWEGRGGGITNRVIGAHAAGANTGSVGAAVLGDFTSAAPPEVVINRLQTLVGWKLALDGVQPQAGNVLGHRQAGTTPTACPGQALFNRMGDIRNGAAFYYAIISDPCYGSTAVPFCDVQSNHPFRSEILWVHDQGIADGYADGTFRPLAPVSRQAMAAFLFRLSGLPSFDAPNPPTFTDVGTNHLFRREIEWLDAEGITTGYPDGRFRPLASISRQAMAAFMYRYAGEPAFDPPATPGFTDTQVGRPFYAEIHWLASTNITTGYADGTFRPDANVSRQAMAAFLFRLDGL